jgi:hypothetical protein
VTEAVLEIVQEPEKVTEIVSEQVVYIGGGGNSSKIIAPEIAGMVLSGHRVLVKFPSGQMFLADKDTPAHMHKVAGVGLNSAGSGSAVQVQSFGELVEPTWNWVEGPVYLGNSGQLTQTVPTSGFLVLIGTATAPTVLRIQLGAPISLA